MGRKPETEREIEIEIEPLFGGEPVLSASAGATRPKFRVPRLFPISPAVSLTARAAAAAVMQRTQTRGRLRVWVPGCKTGTMVYAMAMLLYEAVATSPVQLQLQIFGTDHDEEALALARAGRYPARAAVGLEPYLRCRYTFDEGDTIRVSEALREACVFSRHKLTHDAPLSRMDLLVCHRVFEGLAPSKREQVLDALSYSLRDGGLLLALDHKAWFTDDRFEPLDGGYFRVRSARAKALPQAPSPPAPLGAADGWPFGSELGEARQGSRARQELERAELIRAHSELERFVHTIGVPLLLCDRDLRVRHLSAEARSALGLSGADQGESLEALAERLPGGAELVLAARRAAASQETQELAIRTERHAYLARVSASIRLTGSGVAIVFTDVSALEATKAQAVAQRHQQAAVARIGALALSLAPQAELFEEALSVLFGNIPMCTAGVILERRDERAALEVVAARGFGPDPLRTLRELGAPADLLEAVAERGSPILHSHVGSSAPSLPSVTGGIACPIQNEGRVLGVIALYARQSGIDAPDHRLFIQAIANVLGGAIARHRTRRRLALELEVSLVLAGASDLRAMGGGVAHALRMVLPLEIVEIWMPGSSASGTWMRAFPDAHQSLDLSFVPGEHLLGKVVRYQPATLPGAPHELSISVQSGKTVAAVVRALGRDLQAPDPDLCQGFERIASMLGDFLDRQRILDALRQSEASYRQSSREFETLYASLQRVEANLREADQQKDDFLAMLGHELRNPMAAIRNATELLARVETALPQLERLQSIFERQTGQMTKLIDGLLDVARVARGKVELQLTAVPLRELVRQIVDDRQHQFQERKLDLNLPEAELWVLADQVRMLQILDNLLSNAHKFTLPSGSIRVDVSRTSDRGMLSVTDDGMGIDVDVLPRVFEPFRQGRATHAHAQGGLGLGLALVKGLVELHGFHLDVQSDGPGRGAVFRIDFPLTVAPESRLLESRVEPRELALLVVEDNTDVGETLAELLSASGHSVELARSAEQALEALRSRRPDVVLCDIGLPGMDGMAFATLLRANPALSNLKLVAMTGYSDPTTRARIERAGFNRLLIKPVQFSALHQCLARLTGPTSPEINPS